MVQGALTAVRESRKIYPKLESVGKLFGNNYCEGNIRCWATSAEKCLWFKIDQTAL